tara:strand:- start:3853 stop:4395 length:543 start_codon:yes stop_codon:yes gene_type:complete
MKKSKMSVQQRKYFVERITSTINKQILSLRQQNAAEVYTLSDKHYDDYIKSLKLTKTIRDYLIHKEKSREAFRKIEAVYKEVQNTIVNPNADWKELNTVPSLYDNAYGDIKEDVTKCFKWACNETARNNETTATHTKNIRSLEKKRDKAIDILHGVDEFVDVMDKVNNSLKGTEVPKLGA